MAEIEIRRLRGDILALREQLRTGIVLVERLLSGHAETVSTDHGATEPLELLRDWVVEAPGLLPGPSPRDTVLRCGPMRREPDGSWWWEEHFLGQDDDPETSLAVGCEAGLVAIMLGDTLEAAVERLVLLGDPSSHTFKRLVYRFNRWQSTGVW